MIELQANPDLESLKIWLGVMVALLVLFVGIVGWFLSRRDDAVTAAIANLNKVVDQLEIVVSNIRLEQDIRQPIIAQQLEIHRKGIELNAEKIEGIDKRLSKVETQHEEAYCRFPVKRKKEE